MKTIHPTHNYSVFDLLLITITVQLLYIFTNTISNDYYQYELIYDIIKEKHSLYESIITLRYEPGFLSLYYYLSNYFNSSSLFLLIASTCLIIKYIFFKKYLSRPKIAWCLYIIIFLPISDASQLRTAIVTTFLLYVILNPTMVKRFLPLALFSMLFHYIGAIIFYLKYIKRPLILFSLFILSVLIFDNIIVYINKLSNFQLSYFEPIDLNNNVNVFNSHAIIQSIIIFFSIVKWKYLSNSQKSGALLLSMGLIFFIIMAQNPSIAHRVRETSMLGMFPLFFSYKRLAITHASIILYCCLLYLVFYSIYLNILEIATYY